MYSDLHGTNFYVTGINLKVLSCHFSNKTGRLAAEGKYEEAEQYAAACIRDLEGDELLPSWLAFIICNGEAVYTLLIKIHINFVLPVPHIGL